MNCTLREFVIDEYAVVRGLRVKATYQVLLTLRRWAEFLGREPVASDITNLAVMRFLAHRGTKVSRGSVLKDRNNICGIGNFLARQDRTMAFLTLPPMSPIKRIPRAYTVADVEALLRLSLGLPGAVGGLPRGFWWASIQRAAWETAERVSPLLALTWDDVDLEARTLHFRGETRKGARADILREISPETASWMAHLRAGRAGSDLVWPWPLAQSTLWLEHNRICALAQVTARGFHGFRRSAASYLALAGGLPMASDHLGHATTQMTRDRYVDPSICRPAVPPISILPSLNLGK